MRRRAGSYRGTQGSHVKRLSTLAVFDFPTNCKPHGTPQHAAVLPIRPATPEDIEAVERLHRAVRTACLPYLPELHTPEEDLRFFRGRVFPAYTCGSAAEPGSRSIAPFLS